MSRKAVLLTLALPLLAVCSCSKADTESATVPHFSDVTSLELVIGEDNLPERFQLVGPTGVAVGTDGRILVSDEKCVKVFDAGGNPLHVIGRGGQGPGEFEGASAIHVGSTGLIAVQDILFEVDIFDPEGRYVTRNRYREIESLKDYIKEKGFTGTMLNAFVALDRDRWLIELWANNRMLEPPFLNSEPLFVATPDGVEEIAFYRAVSHMHLRNGGERNVDFQGELLWAYNGIQDVVYTETAHLRHESRAGSSYDLIRVDLATMERDTLSIPYEPVRIPPACKQLEPIIVESIDLYLPVPEEVQEIIERTEHYPPLIRLLADGSTAFGFAHCELDSAGIDPEEMEVTGPRWADVIDLDSGDLICRAEFPFLPDLIRDGYAYRIRLPEADLPVVEKYRIDPRVYRGG